MSNAKPDGNGKTTIIGILNTDGATVTRVQTNPSNHALEVSNGTTGSDNGNNAGLAQVDGNGKPVWTALSSVDGKTIIEVYVNSSGQLLIQST